ncbi:CBS domain-containing protein [Amycolatopsis acidicola]|uniref:CBS domain-containing protein n=2 Tax=Amycolatopsis acidicola TaxID=2596893 RepID=A0A5N0UU28_9PSEU|nr:CBS domain-containing protein [Amycolatopsis acidicola]
MTRDVHTVPPEAEFKDIARLLARERISAVPVVAGDGTVLGVVSEADLLPKQQRAPGRHARRWRHKAEASLARDLMTSPARTVDIGAPLAEVVRQLLDAGVRRLFVLDDGKLAGVLARRDVVGVFLRGDEELAAEIEDEVFHRALLADPGRYSITVVNGDVTLLGRLERKSAVRAAGELSALIPGVLSVCNRLDYVWDDEDR